MRRQEQTYSGGTVNIVVTDTDLALIDCYRDEPAPLLPILHAFHDRDGYISAEAIEAVGKALRIPLADLYGTITFYHHFARESGGLQRPRVCTGPVCCLRGALEILNSLDGAEEMPCAGRCDDPVPILIGHETFVASLSLPTPQRRVSSPLPAPNPGGREECVFAAIREPERASLDGYRRSGGYDALTQAAQALTPAQVIDLLKESKLAGRGGAGFPTGMKWQFARAAEGGPKSVVCNADEGEPGCFKDRALMDHDPFALIEGMTLAGYAIGAQRGFLYLRYEYPETYERLERAIQAAEEAGLLGENVLGGDFCFRLYLRRGAGAYICGEETSLLNSLEGKHPFPRNRPPYPTTHGFENLPTAVNNVETLCAVPQILRRGADWYQSLGLGDHAGTKVISLSGDVQRPGNYEVPFGLPLRTLLHDWAGGLAAWAYISGGDHGRNIGRLSGRRRDRDRHPGRAEHPVGGVDAGRGRRNDFRRQPRHRGNGAPGDGVFRTRKLWQMFPLPHRHAAPAGTVLRRRPQAARRLEAGGKRHRRRVGIERVRVGRSSWLCQRQSAQELPSAGGGISGLSQSLSAIAEQKGSTEIGAC